MDPPLARVPVWLLARVAVLMRLRFSIDRIAQLVETESRWPQRRDRIELNAAWLRISGKCLSAERKACSMQINEAIRKSSEEMFLGAKAFKDKGYTAYEARLHAALVGRIIANRLNDGMQANDKNFAALFHALYNHSAWRQKFEKEGIFPKAGAKESGLDNLLASLDEEGV